MIKELLVLSKSKKLAGLVFNYFRDIKDLQYTYTPQMIRSSLSIPFNIAEGSQRGSKKEFIRFINIARGSLSELKVQLEILKECRFPNVDDYDKQFKDKGKLHEITQMLNLIEEIGKMSYGLILKLKTGDRYKWD